MTDQTGCFADYAWASLALWLQLMASTRPKRAVELVAIESITTLFFFIIPILHIPSKLRPELWNSDDLLFTTAADDSLVCGSMYYIQ